MRVRAHGPSASVTVAILSSYELSANSPGWLAEAIPATSLPTFTLSSSKLVARRAAMTPPL